MSKLTRRDSFKLIALAGVSAGAITGCIDQAVTDDSHTEVIKSKYPDISASDLAMLQQKFFTEAERAMVQVLANHTIPADDVSDNAEAAGVVEFIEFMMLDQPGYQVPIRGGLNWVNNLSRKWFEKDYVLCSEEQQMEILDAIAYPDTAEPDMGPGVAFFNRFRNLVATGFWTSETGIRDLQYMGNTVWKWDGAPREWLDRLGVNYD